jgi:hypothetical protein
MSLLLDMELNEETDLEIQEVLSLSKIVKPRIYVQDEDIENTDYAGSSLDCFEYFNR